MPVGSIIDTHLHLWDPRLIRYPWLDENVWLNRTCLLEDYRAATGSVPVEAMVFVQCEAEFSAFEREAAWASDQAKLDPRILGLVAWAPLEKGRDVSVELERLKRYEILRGIRRIIQFEPDPDFCLRPDFIEGIRTLKHFDLSFEICIDHRHLANVVTLAQRVPDVPMILDHIGKPAIKARKMTPWAAELRALARCPNVVCKISGVATEADHRTWHANQLKPYIDVAIEAFGFDRILFGGDWPVSTQAIRFEHWVSALDDILTGVCEVDQRKFWRDNAVRVYRLGSNTKCGQLGERLT
jgi:L-fuconolactonase